MEAANAEGGRGRSECVTKGHVCVTRRFKKCAPGPPSLSDLGRANAPERHRAKARVRSRFNWRARQDSNLRPSA